MKPVRLFFLLLLSFALPINGMAQALMVAGQGTLGAHESMQMPAHHAHQGMAEVETDCFEAGDSGKGSQVCKSGQECKTSSLLQLSLGKPLSLPLGQAPALPPSEPAPALIPDAVWHPPRA